jgi:hypothetical protein
VAGAGAGFDSNLGAGGGAPCDRPVTEVPTKCRGCQARSII